MNPLLASSTVKSADAVNNGKSSASFTFAKPAAPPKVHTHALRTLTECTEVLQCLSAGAEHINQRLEELVKKPACVLCYWSKCEAGGIDRPQSLCIY